MFKYTYGYWEMVRNEIRNTPFFMFNWVVLTRSIFDIQKRCDYIIKLFKKELYGEEELKSEEKVNEVAPRKSTKVSVRKRGKAQQEDASSNTTKIKVTTDKNNEVSKDSEILEVDNSEEEDSYNPKTKSKGTSKESTKVGAKRGRKPKKRGRKPKDKSKLEESTTKPTSKRSAKEVSKFNGASKPGIVSIDTTDMGGNEGGGQVG